MTGAKATAGFAMEILVEQNQITPVRIGLEFLQALVDGSLSSLILQKDTGKATRQLAGYFPKGKHLSRASGKFNFEGVPEVMMELLQGFDQQII